MSGWFQNTLRDAAGAFFGSDFLRDYTHASKAFQTNLYQNAPKFKYLFHTYFNINQDIYNIDEDVRTQQNFGILVHDVKLPSYQFQTFQMNQYNRKRVVQTKIKYDPVTFTFYDDNGNNMAKMWAAYYTYYYNDGFIPQVGFNGVRGTRGVDFTMPPGGGTVRGLAGAGSTTLGPQGDPQYFKRTTYAASQELENNGALSYGYIGQSSISKDNGTKIPFFKDITVYGFYQHNWIAYTLINPIITQFAHDTYNYEEGTGVMKNTMTLDYETVVYNEGALDGNKPSDLVPGFGDDTVYDRRVSPIAEPGSNSNILGQGGLVNAVGGAVNNLSTNPLYAIKAAGAAYNTFKNVNIVQNLKQELKTGFMNALRQRPNETRALNFKFDNWASGPNAPGNAGSPPTATGYGTDNVQNNDITKSPAVTVDAQQSPTLNNFGSKPAEILTGLQPDTQVATTIANDESQLQEVQTTGRTIPPDEPAAKETNSGTGFFPVMGG